MRITLVLALAVVLLGGLQWYAWQGMWAASAGYSSRFRKLFRWAFRLSLTLFWVSMVCGASLRHEVDEVTGQFILAPVFVLMPFYLILAGFVLLDDLRRLFTWAVDAVQHVLRPPAAQPAAASGQKMTRSEFLSRTGVIVATAPVVMLSKGIISGAYDYQLREVALTIPNLPKAFHGLRIGQLSDIHSGSFFNPTAVKGGVEMLLKAKPDLIAFTGDLVNDRADEMADYQRIFAQVKAPLGVYSVLGNHDYGDYTSWPSAQAKARNLQHIKDLQRAMGWRLLLNEHELLTQGGEQLAIIGVENWGAGRFVKHGDLQQAAQGTEQAATKILLSHDPSHWDAQVRPQYADIDLTLAGHTHGMQMGIEVGSFKWSPSQYIYEQWAGLYQKGPQQIYVNRGFGYHGFPGRVGILPEVTILELRCA